MELEFIVGQLKASVDLLTKSLGEYITTTREEIKTIFISQREYQEATRFRLEQGEQIMSDLAKQQKDTRRDIKIGFTITAITLVAMITFITTNDIKLAGGVLTTILVPFAIKIIGGKT